MPTYSYQIFFDTKVANKILLYLRKKVIYEQPTIRLYGKNVLIPRKQAVYGNVSYSFSGVEFVGREWTRTLQNVRNIVSKEVGYDFNFVLINYYENGKNYISFHKDDEPDLDPNAPIVSLSFGASRDFIFKKNGDSKKVLLEHGSLLIIPSETNRTWSHGLPRRLNCTKPRYNLTFRVIKQ